VSQVDDEGYVLPGAFDNAVSNLFTEVSLKIIARKVAPDCITQSNKLAKGRYKAQQI